MDAGQRQKHTKGERTAVEGGGSGERAGLQKVRACCDSNEHVADINIIISGINIIISVIYVTCRVH